MNACLKKTTQVKNVYSVADIDKTIWSEFQDAKFFLSIDYLKAIEKDISEVNSFIYSIYFKNNQAVGISVFKKIKLDFDNFDYNSIPCQFPTHFIKKYLKKKIDVLMCGNIFSSSEQIFAFNNDISNEYIFKSLNDNINSILAEDKKIKYVIFKEFEETNKNANVLEESYQYYKFNIDVSMVVNFSLQYAQLEDYIQNFKAKYRTRANKVLNNSNKLEIKEFDSELIAENAQDIQRLYLSVLKNSNFNIGTFGYETFFNLKLNLKDNYHFFAYYYEGKIVGFMTYFQFDDIIDASFVGVDYSINQDLNIYQKILLDYIDRAIESKATKINLGRTAETIKGCVGAEPKMNKLYIKHRNLIGNTVLKKAITFVKPTEYSVRKPFKQEYYK